MTSKKELFKNLQNFSPDEIAEAVRRGEVTLYELSKNTNGAFTPLLKRRVQTLLEKPQRNMAEVHDNVNEAQDMPSNPMSQQTTAPMSQQSLDSRSPYQVAKDSELFDRYQMQTPYPSSHAEVQNSSGNSNRGMFKRPFSFKGRIRRMEFGLSCIICFVWNIIIDVTMSLPDPSLIVCLFVLISIIPMTWFMWAQAAKRCHDRGISGWFQLIPFFYLVLLFGKGEPGANKYGDSPKE